MSAGLASRSPGSGAPPVSGLTARDARTELDPLAAAWERDLNEAFGPVQLASVVDACANRLERATLGNLTVLSLALGAQRWSRTARATRHRRAPFALTITVTAGAIDILQGGRTTAVRPGAVGLVDGELPFCIDVSGATRAVILVVGRDLFARRCLPRLGIGAVPAASSGATRPISAFMAVLPEAAADTTLTAAERHRLEHRTLDLLQLAFTATSPVTDVRAQHLARAKVFIDNNLADADLSPAVVAAGAAVSLRYLHRLFRSTGETVRQHIIQRRLDVAYAALTDVTRANQRVATIATSVGFKTPAHFSRCFTDRYGQTPSEVRAAAADSEARAAG